MTAVSEKRAALVGFGHAGEAWRDALREIPEISLCAVVEPDCLRAPLASAEGVPVFDSVPEMLAAGVVPDVAVLATPPTPRLGAAGVLMRAGVDLLCETPLAPDSAGARFLEESADRLGRTISTASRFRCARALFEARRLIASGRIGRLAFVAISLGEKRDASGGWRGEREISGGGVWMDAGPQALDAAEALLGPVRRIRMLERRREQGAEVEDVVRVETEHADGGLAHLHLSWNGPSAEPIARCVGSDGELWLGWAQTVIAGAPGREVVGAGYDEREALCAALEDFLSSRCGGVADSGAGVVDWLTAGYRSAGSGNWERS
jgi:predicted dehydrogenase